MSEEERKFLEIVDLKKGFGSGETRQEVLRGMNFSVAKGGDGARDRIRIRQDVCRTLRPADAACETPFGSLRRAQLGRDSLRRVGSSGPPTLSSETRQSFFTEKRDRPSR